MKLRQICLDPSLVVDNYTGESGKIRVAMELIRDNIESGKKILLFSQFTTVLSKIGEVLKKNNIEYLELNGSTPAKKRINIVNEFNSHEDIKIFLISLKAGGTGLNLTSASLVIHFDPWWNPAVEDQATDRAHRIGQKNIVEVIKLIAKGTIEEKIVFMQNEKKELINSIIDSELKNSDALNRLSKQQLIEIFTK
jgi:SNF2 family DNA or RNA helicase